LLNLRNGNNTTKNGEIFGKKVNDSGEIPSPDPLGADGKGMSLLLGLMGLFFTPKSQDWLGNGND
jgi:hypothetical protein